ncbi:hypothetical protein [Desulfovibrio piger]|uniref:hypothetical protein n=1 Tax=Desulfovibrio piger TaxID=901 RepID=UPI0039F62B85
MAQTRHLVLGLMPRGADPDTHWAAGPWCFDTEEDFFPGWEDSFVFGREPLRDPATLDRAVLMAQSLAVDSIPALGRHLLGLHRGAPAGGTLAARARPGGGLGPPAPACGAAARGLRFCLCHGT